MTIFGYLIKKLEGTFFTKIPIPINTERYKEALGVALRACLFGIIIYSDYIIQLILN
jgi:hypothetical protein